jgi:hypothetical protein
LFPEQWQRVSSIEVGDIRLKFQEVAVTCEAPFHTPEPLPPAPPQPAIPDIGINDADLALSPPAGMLAPAPAVDPDADPN